jgi:hypothetical protein
VLLRHGADVNQRFGRRASTPLLLAGSIYRRPKFLKLLLDAGADVNVPSYDGSTALVMYAARVVSGLLQSDVEIERGLEAMRMLLARGTHLATAPQIVASYRKHKFAQRPFQSEIHPGLTLLGKYAPLWRVRCVLEQVGASPEIVAQWKHAVGCEVCRKCPPEGLGTCSRCELVSYCGAACQHSDWPAHKARCREFVEATKK